MCEGVCVCVCVCAWCTNDVTSVTDIKLLLCAKSAIAFPVLFGAGGCYTTREGRGGGNQQQQQTEGHHHVPCDELLALCTL